MLILSLLWLLIGLIVGALALLARLKPAGWSRLWLLALGLGSALAGGWLATWLLGRYDATLTALWIAILAVSLPWLLALQQQRTKPKSTLIPFTEATTEQKQEVQP